MPEAPRRRPALPGIVKSLGLVSLLNDLASEMMYPLLPALVEGLGGGALALGTLDGVAEAVSALFKLVAGRLADRPGWRRPLVVVGYAIAAVARPLMGVAGVAWQVIGLRAVDRVGKGARTPPRDAVLADATDPTIRGRAFGFHRMMDHAGAMLGPLVAFALLAGLTMRPAEVILWSAVPGLAAVLVVSYAMRRIRPGSPLAAEPAAEAPSEVASTDDSSRPMRAAIVLVVLFAAARLPETLMLLRLQGLGVPLTLLPIVWALLHAVRTGASYPGGWLSDRAGPLATMLIGWALYACVAVGLAIAAGPWTAVLWFMLFGLVAGATESPERALIAAWGRRRERGTKFGIYHASVGLVALPGGIALGALYQWVGAPAAFGASAGAAALLTLVGLALRPVAGLTAR
ncbi:MAG TPA: MFS transporter [Gemmatimonadales bacterium]|nr:MFS transporter [Gemmatimonadales bacterium]